MRAVKNLHFAFNTGLRFCYAICPLGLAAGGCAAHLNGDSNL